MKAKAVLFLSVSLILGSLLAGQAHKSILIQNHPVTASALQHGNAVRVPQPAGLVPAATQRQVLASYAKLPLSFEANRGQTDRRVKFVSRGSGYTLFLTPKEAVLSLRKPRAAALHGPAARRLMRSSPADAAVVRLELAGANPAPEVVGVDEQPGKSNYFIGNDPSQWRNDVPSYARVAYRDVYPGINLIYYGNQRQLETDFVVAPGAEPRAIALDVRGPGRLKLNEQGDLVLSAADGEISLRKPVVYQETNGARQTIDAKYVFRGAHRVGVEVAAYDSTRPLVIDPVVGYASYLGGSQIDVGFGIAVDSNGSAYVTGETVSTDFPTQTPLQAANGGGAADVFISKFNAAGSALVYSTYLGGNGDDEGFAIAVDGAGNAYVTGITDSTNFPLSVAPQPLPFQGTFNGGVFDAFVTKLNPAGSTLMYSTYLGGGDDDEAFGIAADANGNAFVAGFTVSSVPPPFPTTASAFQGALASATIADMFLTRIDTTKSGAASLIYSTYLGGTNDDEAFGVATDGALNAYLVGETSSTDFPTKNAFQAANGGGADDAVLAQIDTSKSGAASLIYSTYYGGALDDVGNAIALDSTHKAYITGRTASTAPNPFPTKGAFQPTFGGGAHDAFVAKFDTSQTGAASQIYSSYLGGSDDDQGLGIGVDSNSNAYVTGFTLSTNFPTVLAFQNALGGAGSDDIFISKVNAAGSALVYSSYLGGASTDEGFAIAVDANGNAYITGRTASNPFPTTTGAFKTTFGGIQDAFAVKISSAPVASLAPAVLPAFANTVVGSSSTSQTVTLTNTGEASLNNLVITIGGTNPADFSSATTCGASLAAGANCTVNVTFKPTAAGARAGTLNFADNAANSPQTVALAGTGQDFSVSAAPTTITVKAGASGNSTLTITPLSGFNQATTVTCTGAPSQSTCTASPSPVTPNGAAVTSTVTVTTTAPSMLAPPPVIPPSAGLRFGLPWLAFLAVLAMAAGLVFTRRRRMVLCSGVAVLVLLGCLGCANKKAGSGGTPIGNSTLTVTATAGTLSHSQQITLTVQ